MQKAKAAFICLVAVFAACLDSNAQPKATDSTVNAGDDFYQYINKAWLDTAKIPEDLPISGGFATLSVQNQQKLRGILEELAAKPALAKGSNEQKVGDLYASGMDTDAINALGYKPLLPVLERIDAVKNYKQLLLLIAHLYKEGNGQLLGFSVAPDLKNSKTNIVNFNQAGTSLPEKSYYTNMDETSKLIRARLQEYITNMFVLTGTKDADAQASAQAIIGLETSIAASHLSNIQLRDPESSYHKMSVASLQKLTPHIDWGALFAVMGVVTDSVNVAHPAYLKTIDTLLYTLPIETWKNKVKYVYINTKAGLLGRPFRDAEFAFNQVFSGQPAQPERWKVMVGISDGELLGQLYVKKYFTPAAKAKMDTLVNNLLEAFKIRLQHLDWMSESTKKEALLKLSRITKKIGYPDKIRDYSDVVISRTDFFGNNESYARHAYRESILKINKPVDRLEWQMTTPTVNAYYNPANNEIVFPAGILQPPFFDVNADDATNYGAIGMVISHEITHGFDDEGRQFDAAGNLRDWWTKEDADKFKQRTQVLVDQYSQFKVLGKVPVNGQLTLGENIADQGGIAIAYDAFKMTAQGKSNTVVNGYTTDMLFFKSFATVWRSKARDNYAAMLVNVDTHSPDKFRVNGTLANFAPFYQTYTLTPVNLLYRKEGERAKIW
jgi:putative endopeptidase